MFYENENYDKVVAPRLVGCAVTMCFAQNVIKTQLVLYLLVLYEQNTNTLDIPASS